MKEVNSYSNQDYDTDDKNTQSYHIGRSPQRNTPPYIGAILHQEKCPPQMLAITPYNVTIPPHSRTILPLGLIYWRTIKILLLEPLHSRNNHGLKVAHTVVWIHRREYCSVWNDTNEHITLKYGTPLATVSTIQDKLKSCFLEESIQEYRDAKDRRNTRGINNIYSRNNRRHFYTNNPRRSYANDRRHSYAHSANQMYAKNARHSPRRPYANDRRRA